MAKAAATPKFKVLDKRIARSGSTDVVCKVTTEFDGKKILFTLRNNFYKPQCSAFSQIWQSDKLEWSNVVSLIPGDMKMREGMGVLGDAQALSETVFAQDLKELERLTAMVLA